MQHVLLILLLCTGLCFKLTRGYGPRSRIGVPARDRNAEGQIGSESALRVKMIDEVCATAPGSLPVSS